MRYCRTDGQRERREECFLSGDVCGWVCCFGGRRNIESKLTGEETIGEGKIGEGREGQDRRRHDTRRDERGEEEMREKMGSDRQGKGRKV